MSPVMNAPTTPMKPTPLLPMHAGFSPEAMAAVFPPSIDQLKAGIMRHRSENGYETANTYPHHTIKRLLVGEEFNADSKRLRIADVTVHPISNGVVTNYISDIEMNSRLLVAPIAAAIAAHPYIGTGNKENAKKVKAEGDGAATQAMRTALNNRSIKGEIRGGEGGGRDGMTRSGALYMGEPVGTGYGLPVHFLVDPLEVTNSTKALDPEGAYGSVGHGWAAELTDLSKWYPGYSGASSLMLAVDARKGGTRLLSDFLYLDKWQVPYSVAKALTAQKLSFGGDPKQVVNALSSSLRLPITELRAAALARSRHLKTMEDWIKAGIEPWNIFTPSDGDAMFAPAIAAGALHFAGLTGGVMEGVVSAALGIPMGIRTYMQFVSHDSLGEHKENANLLDEAHRFGFSDEEYAQMRLTELYDREHIGHILRSVDRDGPLTSHIKNAAFFAKEQGVFSEEQYNAFLRKYRAITGSPNNGERFSDDERQFLAQVLGDKGYLDVRRVINFGDMVTTRSWVAAVSSITPNKWAPLEGIRTRDHKLIVDTLVVGGSNVVYILETGLEEI